MELEQKSSCPQKLNYNLVPDFLIKVNASYQIKFPKNNKARLFCWYYY